LPSDDIKPLAKCSLVVYDLFMPKYKPDPNIRHRKGYNLSFDPSVYEPFRALCLQSGMTISRVFEGFADVFLKSMRPGESLREEYARMMTLYFNYRRDNYDVPDVVSEVNDS